MAPRCTGPIWLPCRFVYEMAVKPSSSNSDSCPPRACTHQLSQENRDQTCRPYLGSGKQAQPAHPSCVFVRCRLAGSETKCITHSQPKIAPGSYLCSRYIEEEGHAICLSTLIAVTSTASSLLRSQSSPKKLVHRMCATYFFSCGSVNVHEETNPVLLKIAT